MSRNVLLTGGSRGIGLAISTLLVERGYNIFVPSRKELDLANVDSVSKFCNEHKNSKYDILINCAGINLLRTLEEIDQQDFNTMIQVNLNSALMLTKLCAGHMKNKRSGRIVNISSIWGVSSKENRTLYSITKYALNGLTKSLSRELGEYNILINSVCPGYIATEMTNQNLPPLEQERLKKIIPLRRFADPKEVADVVEYLVSERNTYITGQNIIIDGGFLD